MSIKAIICTAGGLAGAAVAAIWGGWGEAMTILCVLMAIDYIAGILVAAVWHRSPKTETGGLESLAGLKGLIRKVFILALVAVAHMIDRLIGTNYIRDAVAIAFSLNEIISILENAGLMGIPIPKVMQKGLELLRRKAGEDEEQTHITVKAYDDYDEDGSPIIKKEDDGDA